MSINDYDSDSFVGRDDVADAIIQQALDTDADAKQCRSQLIDGPAHRGKSWLLFRVRDRLDRGWLPPLHASPQAQQSHPAQVTPSVVSCLFTKENVQPFDLSLLVAHLWLALHPHLPSLLWPQSVLETDSDDEKVRKICAFFARHSARSAERLIEIATEELQQTNPLLYLLILVDGLDEFERSELDRFEREFITPLFHTPNVRLVSSRRSEVITHNWRSYLVRLHTHIQTLEAFPALAVPQQVDKQFAYAGSTLRFVPDLQPHFKVYAGQNPGANSFFVQCALAHHKAGHHALLTPDDIKNCVLELSQSDRHTVPIAEQDFIWLSRIVTHFPAIGTVGAPRHQFNQVLDKIADKERNNWLGHLQERGIVVVATNGLCRVHEEFVALCQEWEASKLP